MTASGAVGIMVVAGVLAEMSLETGVNFLVEAGVLVGGVKVINKGEGEEAVQAAQSRMLILHEFGALKFWQQIFDMVSAEHSKRIQSLCLTIGIQ